ncbi:hypothetical protein BFW87_20760 [Pseudomonas fluorescens]|uniref:Uncharacterized protein n=1 Tax=Pseudomonas fluorescens TaxID=294 RepID=A0A1T2YFG7_PSEFL|nr:hypothetical protein BFW87_20760 [Pseudomonas fluorescens]
MWGSKGAHLTRICPVPVGLHNFDMQSSGGILTSTPAKHPAGYVMSFPAYLRSQSEQVPSPGRLMIKASALH